MAGARKREAAPPEVLEALGPRLQSGLPRAIVLKGEERYFHERAVDLVRAAAEREGYEVLAHDAEKGNPDYRVAALVDDLSGGGLFTTRRLVLVRHADEALKKVGGDPSPVTDAVERFLSAPEDHGCVLLSGSALRADHPAVKAVSKAGGLVLAFRRLWDAPPPWSPDPREAELVQWILRRARESGVRLDPRQAVYVAAATGNDLFAIDDQLARLAAGGGRFEDVVGWQASAAPWEVAGSLLAGDLPRGLAGVETLFQGGFLEKGGRRTVDPVALTSMLLGSLSRGARQALAVATEVALDGDGKAALARAGVAGSPVMQKATLERASRRTPAGWRRVFVDCLELESRMKSGERVDADAFAALALRWRVEARVAARRR